MKYLSILFILFASTSGFAQDFKGVWLGYMDTDLQHIRTLNVSYILLIKEQDNNIVNGKAYLYRDNPLQTEGILDFIGVINKGSLRINKPSIYTLRLNRNQELHEIILYAENLGRIPPNTSNLRIHDGIKEHQVLI